MSRPSATSGKPRTRQEREALLAKLVAERKLTRRQADLIDLRDLTPRERAFAETLEAAAKRALESRC